MKTVEIGTKLMNKYHIQLKRGDEVIQEINFHNTVTDWWAANTARNFVRRTGITVAIGDGDGIHTASDLQLFHSIWNSSTSATTWTYSHEANSSAVQLTWSRTFNETEIIGSLSEIGLFTNSNLNQPFCLANFQDGEGHAITIDKTKYDVLTLDIVLELTMDTSRLPSNIMIPHRVFWNIYYNRNPQPIFRNLLNPSLDSSFSISFDTGVRSGSSTSLIPNWFSWALGLGRGPNGSVCLSSAKNVYSASKAVHKTLETANPSTIEVGSDLVNRWVSTSPVAASANNNLIDDKSWQVMSIWLERDGILLGINLPDHDIFPPTELEFEVIGDGLTTDFNLSVPVLMADSPSTPVSISINNVPLSSSEYDWYGKNYQSLQAWSTIDGSNMIDFSTYYATSNGSGTRCPTLAYANTEWINFGAQWIEYRFPSAISVDCVARLGSWSNTSAVLVWDEQAGDWASVYNFVSNESGIIQLSQPVVSARWKVTTKATTANATQTSPLPLFGTYSEVSKPQIRFHTAPPDGAVVRIKAYTEYPCKTSDWIFDTISFDVIKKAN